MANTDELTRERRAELRAAVFDHASKLLDQERLTFDGRKIPDEEALQINLGRNLKVAVLFMDICGFSKIPAGSAAEQERLLMVDPIV